MNTQPVEVFKDGVSFDDVQQGGLGNCYFCCMVSGMAKYVGSVQDLFANP